jgi:hypothetical protein
VRRTASGRCGAPRWSTGSASVWVFPSAGATAFNNEDLGYQRQAVGVISP